MVSIIEILNWGFQIPRYKRGQYVHSTKMKWIGFPLIVLNCNIPNRLLGKLFIYKNVCMWNGIKKSDLNKDKTEN